VRCGEGTCEYANGDIYQGNLSTHHKRSVQTSSAPVMKHVHVRQAEAPWGAHTTLKCHAPAGHWQHDQRHGFGRCKFADGTHFAGRWEDDGWVQSAADAARSGIPPECLPLRTTAGHDCCFTIQVHDCERRVYWQLDTDSMPNSYQHKNCGHMQGNVLSMRTVSSQKTDRHKSDPVAQCRHGTTSATSASRGATNSSLSCVAHRQCTPQ
jgi:MORN repeat